MVAGCCLLVCFLMLNVHLLGTPSGDSTSVVLLNLLVPFFRSGRISSVYIVGCWLVGHTFSKCVNFECVGVLGVC